MEYRQRKGAQNQLNQFRKLMLELSARLIGMQPYDICREIDRGLELAAEIGMFDLFTLIELSDGGRKTSVIYSYLDQEIKESAATVASEDVQWFLG
jgi:hypothetical protein